MKENIIVFGILFFAITHLFAEDISNDYQVNTWLGKSEEWNAGENWSTGKVPEGADKHNVLLPSACKNYPILKSDINVDGILFIKKGAKLTAGKNSIVVWNSNPKAKSGIINKGELLLTKESVITLGCGGLKNEGEIKGTPQLIFKHPYYKAKLSAGKASFKSITLKKSNYSHTVSLLDNIKILKNLIIEGGKFVVNKGARLEIHGDLVFNGEKKRTTSMAVLGSALLYGDIISNNSPICRGFDEKKGGGWLTLAGKNEQKVRVSSADGILPPLKIEKPAGTVKISGDMSCAGLWICKGNTLDVTAAKKITFGGGNGSTSGWSMGLINNGTLKGIPSLLFSTGCYKAKLETKGAPLSGLTIATGHSAYSVHLKGNLTINGNLIFKTGSFYGGNNTITITGSCFFPPYTEKTDSLKLNLREKSSFIFSGPLPAIIESGSPRIRYNYSTCLQNLVIKKPKGTFKITTAPLVVKGKLKVENDIILTNGGEIWQGVIWGGVRGQKKVVDVGLKIKSTLTKEMMPEINPTKIPKKVSGVTLLVDNVVGPKLPTSLKLVNIAPFANIKTVPYTTMVRNFVDKDEKLRTLSQPEKGTPVKMARYEFRFDKPQLIYQIRWSVPTGPWALLSDTTGDGIFDKLIRMDSKGVITSAGGGWVSRAWITNNFSPATKAYAIQLVSLSKPLNLYDIQILVPAETATIAPTIKGTLGVPIATPGKRVKVETPSLDKQFMKGFHIEPWMFGIQNWLNMEKDKRPPLSEFKPLVDFIKAVKKVHGNTLNMWPPKSWQKPKGKGTYEMDMLWPSKYDKWGIDENVLQMIVKVFHENNIKLMVMGRCPYPKKLEEFPKTDSIDKPGLIHSRHSREYLKGIVLEEVNSGIDMVGIGFDEQQGNRYSLREAKKTEVKAEFEKRHKVKVPEKKDDTESYRHWLVFNYEEFGSYLAEAATAAKKANPNVLTKSPSHVNLGILWNRRIDIGIAEDILAHTADLDFMRAYNYETFDNLGHYVTAANTKRISGANNGYGSASLHNCPWANNPKKFPGYYLHFPPIYMSGSPVSSVMHGGRVPLYWRYNYIYYGGYDKYVKQAYSILNTLASWGGKEATLPKQILVLKSRASEDWWQLRQRYNSKGNLMDQTRGYIYEKWLLEFLLNNGYQFQIRYMDYPEDYEKELTNYDLLILPFPYSISKGAFKAISKATDNGTKLLIFDKQGETDEWGKEYKNPILSNLIKSGKATFISEDVPTVGHYRTFLSKMKNDIDQLLGQEKLLTFNSYGNDVEVACLEKGANEKIICLINWTDRPLSVDLGLLLPENSKYEMLQRDLSEVRKITLKDKEIFTAKDLKLFQVPLKKWEIKLLYVKPTG